jgi:hypothetical protein
MRGGLTEGAAARGKRTREELDALGKELPAAQLLRATAGCGAIGGAPILLGLGDGGALGARAAAASAGVSMPAGISLPASLSGLFDFALPPMLSPSRAAGSGADALHAGQQQVPPGGQGVVGALAPPPASDQNVYSKWAMMLQQQLESAYLERSRILQLAIKLQLENLHLKEALFSENAQRFLQLVQVRPGARARARGREGRKGGRGTEGCACVRGESLLGSWHASPSACTRTSCWGVGGCAAPRMSQRAAGRAALREPRGTGLGDRPDRHPTALTAHLTGELTRLTTSCRPPFPRSLPFAPTLCVRAAGHNRGRPSD